MVFLDLAIVAADAGSKDSLAFRASDTAGKRFEFFKFGDLLSDVQNLPAPACGWRLRRSQGSSLQYAFLLQYNTAQELVL